jgi:hypothetical protein
MRQKRISPGAKGIALNHRESCPSRPPINFEHFGLVDVSLPFGLGYGSSLRHMRAIESTLVLKPISFGAERSDLVEFATGWGEGGRNVLEFRLAGNFSAFSQER